MSEKQSRKSARRFLKAFLLSIIISVTVLFVVVNFVDLPMQKEPADVAPVTTLSDKNSDEVIATASLSSVGDLLIHAPVFNSVWKQDGSYDFNPIFQYVKPYLEKADFCVANLEVSLGGTENGLTYSGYPLFNCPDSIVDAAKNMGTDMLLLANNHTYDCGYSGFIRKIGVIANVGLKYTGVGKDNTEKLYNVVNVNGIKIGIVNYTYETPSTGEGNKAINGILLDKNAVNLVNTFNYDKLEEFYDDLENKMAQMKNDGAEVIVVYPHWGTEYLLEANEYQSQMAQKMCDLGVDVIVGGHPHVVEPVEVIKSEISDKRTVCLYSLGNFISNQRSHLMNLSTGNTEDGVIFTVNFEKYGDGHVAVKSVEVIPTWVNLSDGNYRVIPLDKKIDDWKSAFGLNDFSLDSAKGSYDRTMALVGQGIDDFNNNELSAKDAA
ncbi:MAG: CapA family protein [Ruminococcaceae bacterium]|nr:CapA family protein [Oscillospiraceae bacterium]